MKPTVSLCLIVKDEGTVLARCLASFEGVVDEICIMDTGSTDDTIKIAQGFGARIGHFKWNNSFSDARNKSLEMATKDWIIVVDADEYLRREDLPALRHALALKDYDGYLIKTLNFNQEGSRSYITNLNQRIIRNNGNFHYEGLIHEQVVCKDPAKKSGGFPAIEVGFYHTGYLESERKSKNKKNRNLELLEAAARQGGETMFSLFNLANEISHDEDRKEEALELYNKAYSFREFQAGFMPKLMMFRIMAMKKLGRYQEALEAIQDGLKVYPGFTDLVYHRGQIEKEQGLVLKAIATFECCFKLGKPRPFLEFQPHSYGIGPHYHLAEIYFKQQLYQKALDHYQKCLAMDRSRYQLVYPIFDCIQGLGLERAAIAKTMRHFFDLQDELNMKVYATLLIDKGFFREAAGFMEETAGEGMASWRARLWERINRLDVVSNV